MKKGEAVMKKLIIIYAAAGLIMTFCDLAQAVPITTDWVNPTACSDGPNNNGFNNPTGAYTDGVGSDGWEFAYGVPATIGGLPCNVEIYSGYGFSIPSAAVIDGIEIRMDAWRKDASSGSMAVELSWDGGASWTATGYGTGALSTGQTTYIKGDASNTWGRTWTANQINNSFSVRQTATIGGSGFTPRVCLDWVPVRVTYTIPEPAAICLLGFGALSLLRRKR